jgi:hypothetical protein
MHQQARLKKACHDTEDLLSAAGVRPVLFKRHSSAAGRFICVCAFWSLVLCSAPSAAATGYYQCIIKELPALVTRPEVSRLVEESLGCIGVDHISLIEGCIAAQTDSQTAICAAYNNLSHECKRFSSRCNENRVDCKKALQVVFSCVPYVSQVNDLLKSAGIDSADLLSKSLAKFDTRSASCLSGAEYVRPKNELFWDQACNDYGLTPISFYQLNSEYYDEDLYFDASGKRVESTFKTSLLQRYALAAPSRERWQRIIVSMIGLESLTLAEDPGERSAAAAMLGQHGDFSAAVKFSLLQALEDSQAAVRAAAAKALRTQGDRKPLVVYALLARLLDSSEAPEVRGNAAIALREQAITLPCAGEAENTYPLGGAENPNDLINGIPRCTIVDASLRPAPNEDDDYFFRMLKNSERCPPRTTPVTHDVFDRYQTPDEIRDFSISANLCYHRVEMRPSELAAITQSALLVAIGAESDVTAKSHMIASLRNIARGIGPNHVLIDKLRFEWAQDRDYRIRQAAVFALGKVARNEPWMLSQLIPGILAQDTSPEVRRTAIAALTEIIKPTVEATDRAFQSYNNGRNYLAGLATDCNSVKKASLSDYKFPEGTHTEFFSAGFAAAKTIYRAKICKDDPTVPIYARSSPGLGDQQVDPGLRQITIEFASALDRAELSDKISLAGKGGSIPLRLKNHQIARAPDQSVLTTVTYEFDTPLKLAEYYQIKIKKGLKATSSPSSAAGAGLNIDLNLLFKTTSNETIGATLATLMDRDPSQDVQYAAAEAFLDTNERFVIEFLVNRLRVEPVRNMSRAATYLMSDHLLYTDISRMSEDDKYEFVNRIITLTKSYIDGNEHMFLGRNPPVKDYLPIPALRDFYRLIGSLLGKNWLATENKEMLITKHELREWLLKKLTADAPYGNRAYTYYERIYYGPLRETLKDIFDKHLLVRTPQTKRVEYIIYEKKLMDESPD